MAGSTSKDACYLCAKHTYLGPERCHRRIGAARLEEFVSDAAVELLTRLDVRGAPRACHEHVAHFSRVTTLYWCAGRWHDQVLGCLSVKR